MAAGPPVLDRHLLKADPGDQPAQEAAALGHLLDRLHHAPGHDPEVAGLALVGHPGEAGHQPVERGGQKALERALVPADPPRVGDVGAAADGGHQLGQQLRRVLQIGVHERDPVAASLVDPGRHRDLHAEVARQAHEHDVQRRVLDPALHQRGRAVAGPVVDVDDLAAAAETAHRLAHAAMQLGQVVLLVVHRHDDGQQHRRLFHQPQGKALRRWTGRPALGGLLQSPAWNSRPIASSSSWRTPIGGSPVAAP